MYPNNVAEVCFFLVPKSQELALAAFAEDERQGYISHWDKSLGPQPTAQQVSDALASPGFARWQAENGGDPLATLRRKAKEALADQAQEQNALVRAVVLELLDYANEQRKRHNQLLQWIGSQTTLLNRGQLAALALNEATPTQAKQAIVSRIENGEAD